MKNIQSKTYFAYSKKAIAVSVAVMSLSCASTVYAAKKPVVNSELNNATYSSMQKYHSVASERAIKNQYIVVFNDKYVNAQAKVISGLSSLSKNKLINYRKQIVDNFSADIASSYNANVLRKYHASLTGFVAQMNHKDMRELLADERVDFIEQDQVMHATATQQNATWGIDRIDQASLPLDNSYTYNQDGTGVKAYIVDTGVLASHSNFGGRVSGGYTAINDGKGTTDCNGHGTHVAGTVGSTTYGVAKNVSLIPVRVLGCDGSGTNSGVIAGVDWVAQNAVLPAVANMSLGGGDSTALDNAVKNAISRGISFVVAAGNSNADACSGSPNKVPEALTIASSTSSDARSSFSSWGSCIDLFAPGSSITSTWHNGGTNSISGTSMAAPHVAGAIALHLQANSSATPTQVTNAIINNAVTGKISNPNGSPNRLLQTIAGVTPTCTPISNGHNAVVNGGSKSNACYVMDIPASASSYSIKTSGGSGDLDLYTKMGSIPTDSHNDCASKGSNSTETCDRSTSGGKLYINLFGWSAYSNVTFTANYGTSNGTTFSGYLSGANQQEFLPKGGASNWFQYAGGTISATMTGPSNADFDLELRRWNGSAFVKVTSSTSPSSNESISYNASSGYYQFRVYSYSGSGNYTLTYNK